MIAIPNSVIMPDCCLALLAKFGGTLKLEDLIEFLEPWHGVNKYTNKIFRCLETNCFLVDPNAKLQLLSKADCKTVVQTLWISKKLKNMDNLLVAENA